MNPPSAAKIEDLAPADPRVTDYDRAHVQTYLRLLDAAAARAPWGEAARIVLGVDPENEPERAKRAYDSHLARARWMVERGYRDLPRADA